MRVDTTRHHVAAPVLSVVIPFYHDDPTPLIEAIAQQADARVEMLVWDDGTGDAALSHRLVSALQTLPAQCTLYTAPANAGRSAARNGLVAMARAPWVLFLDADMLPSDARFLDRYLNAIESAQADVIFGGFTVLPTDSRDRRLHWALSQTSDCADAGTRAELGPKHVASSNLCVRRDVLEAEPFDPGFTGWGWEDSEWAARVARRFRVEHIDNPAIHLGLEADDVILQRFATSGSNYRRFLDAHPDFVAGLPLYRNAKRLARLPGQRAARPLLRALVKSPLPLRLRVLAVKLWRASHYAEAL